MPAGAAQVVRAVAPHVVAVHDTIVRVAASDAHSVSEGWGLAIAAVAAVATVFYLIATVLIFLKTRESVRALHESTNVSAAAVTIMHESVEAELGMLQAMRLEAHDREVSRFEDSFFRLLTLQQGIIRDLTYPETHATASGRNVFWWLADTLKYNYTHREKQSLSDVVDAFIGMHDYALGHYLHTLYQLVRHVARAQGEVHKPTYIKIIRAQLSHAELVLLFYVCLGTSELSLKLKGVTEKYGLLEGVTEDWLFDKTHKPLLPDSAFETD
jgi:hypothetical protein